MRIPFVKYSATGNDFVVLDNRENCFDVNDHTLWKKICHRKEGVGADGVLFFGNSSKADFQMRYVNADGGEASMCGNGGRAITHFAFHKIGLKKDRYEFETTKAIYHSSLDKKYGVKLQMTEIDNWEKFDLSQFEIEGKSIYLETGVPHCVFECQNLEALDLINKARKVRYDSIFPEGTNVNYYEVIKEGSIDLRSYERGVEEETLSCGTGATAAALAMSRFYGWENEVFVRTKGGQLIIQFDKNYSSVYLCGEANPIFEGTFFL